MAISTSLGLAGVSSNLHWKKQQKWFKKITLWNSWMMLERYQLFLLSKPLHLDVLGDFAGMESCEVQLLQLWGEDDPYPETKKSVSRNVYLHILDCQNCSVPPYLQKKRWHVNNPNSPPPPLPPSKTNKNRKQISIRLNQPHHPNHTIPTPCSIHLNHLKPNPQKKWHLHRPHRIGLSRQLAHGHLRHRQAMPQDAQRSTRTAATHGVELRLAFAFRGGGVLGGGV